ncbi:MAG: YidC/Oxa1 family insertase periplasmic-domain containing protein [Phycisphaerales bacterium]
MKRTITTLLAVAIAIGVAVAFIFSQNSKTTPAPESDTPTPVNSAAPAEPPLGPPASGASAGGESQQVQSVQSTPHPLSLPGVGPLSILSAPLGSQPEPVLGSDAPAPGSSTGSSGNPYLLRVQLTSLGAGVQQISLAQYSQQALKHIPYIVQEKFAVSSGGASGGGKPVYTYPLEVRAVIINGSIYSLDHANWFVLEHDDSHAVLQLTLADKDTKVLQITRTYRLAPGSYDLELDQQLKNLSAQPLHVQVVQLGQVDMSYEAGYMGDKRAVILGYFEPNYDRSRSTVFIKGFDFSRLDVMKKPEHATLWPTEEVARRQLELSFVAEANRYFAVALHAPTKTVTTADKTEKIQGRPLDALFPLVNRLPAGAAASPEQTMSVELTSRTVALAPDAAASLDINMFAGPKSPAVIADGTPYSAVGLQHLIIYNLGGCCSWLTFGWLAEYMLKFLTFLHSFLFDWGIGIIIMVAIIRAILHPITKKSQLNMMKFGRQMQSMAPELEKLKKKFADDKNKLNAETMKLYRDKGVNPAAMGAGCLPMLLQMPIWYALYAMLFFAIELRHQPAFYNVFHHLGAMMGFSWSFLTDLSAPDQFVTLGKVAFVIPWLDWHVNAVNLLPILMGVVFYFQQKYTTMTPANPAEMTDQQKTQMKMMKYMIFLFPVMLYPAPAGLNLYILVSTAAGIVDSKIVRKHLKELEARGELDKPSPKKQAKPGGFMDRLQKAAETKRKQMEQAQRQQGKKGRTR